MTAPSGGELLASPRGRDLCDYLSSGPDTTEAHDAAPADVATWLGPGWTGPDPAPEILQRLEPVVTWACYWGEPELCGVYAPPTATETARLAPVADALVGSPATASWDDPVRPDDQWAAWGTEDDWDPQLGQVSTRALLARWRDDAVRSEADHAAHRRRHPGRALGASGGASRPAAAWLPARPPSRSPGARRPG
ncbi:hypothetical protein [Arsenicicoccus dermatophilus]|uniref:hypothetical protein n=1 Tax=Arsenicicoccus dermatophilus TaxID=1076331 RepID=UPI0039170117